MKMRVLGAAMISTAALLFGASGATAENILLKAELKGGNESPPNDSAGAGQAQATYDTETKTLSWKVEYSGLSGPAIGAHIHGPADSGANAGIVIPFPKTGSPIEGSAQLTDSHAEQLLAGKMYVNIHTRDHPGGEIRGNLVK
jgi:hypothetical protein